MDAVDRPFRFTWDFCLVWALLAVPVNSLARHFDLNPWYSVRAFTIVGSLFAVFIVYGPVLFMRQVIRSGSRGWFVFRTLLAIVVTTAMLLAVLIVSGYYTEVSGHFLAFVFAAAATAFLSWRTEKR
jgi:hypothetical protein